MADRPTQPKDVTSVGPGPELTTSTPRWVKVGGGFAILLVLLFAILHFTVGGLGDHKPHSGDTERGLTQP